MINIVFFIFFCFQGFLLRKEYTYHKILTFINVVFILIVVADLDLANWCLNNLDGVQFDNEYFINPNISVSDNDTEIQRKIAIDWQFTINPFSVIGGLFTGLFLPYFSDEIKRFSRKMRKHRKMRKKQKQKGEERKQNNKKSDNIIIFKK